MAPQHKGLEAQAWLVPPIPEVRVLILWMGMDNVYIREYIRIYKKELAAAEAKGRLTPFRGVVSPAFNQLY